MKFQRRIGYSTRRLLYRRKPGVLVVYSLIDLPDPKRKNDGKLDPRLHRIRKDAAGSSAFPLTVWESFQAALSALCAPPCQTLTSLTSLTIEKLNRSYTNRCFLTPAGKPSI